MTHDIKQLLITNINLLNKLKHIYYITIGKLHDYCQHKYLLYLFFIIKSTDKNRAKIITEGINIIALISSINLFIIVQTNMEGIQQNVVVDPLNIKI